MTHTHGVRGVREPHPDNSPNRGLHADPVRHVCGRVSKHAPQTPSPVIQAPVGDTADSSQRGDGYDSRRVHVAVSTAACADVEVNEADVEVKDEADVKVKEEEAKAVLKSKKWVKPTMVGGARRAAPRKFTNQEDVDEK